MRGEKAKIKAQREATPRAASLTPGGGRAVGGREVTHTLEGTFSRLYRSRCSQQKYSFSSLLRLFRDLQSPLSGEKKRALLFSPQKEQLAEREDAQISAPARAPKPNESGIARLT